MGDEIPWWVSLSLLVIALVVVLRHTIVVRQRSMEPTLQAGDRLWVVPCSHPEWGSIIVFRSDAPDGHLLVKRVAALPGDGVRLDDEGTWIDGGWRAPAPHRTAPMAYTLLDSQVFVLGDNPSMSEDSRFFGPVAQVRIVSQAVARYWPLTRLVWWGEGCPYPAPRHLPWWGAVLGWLWVDWAGRPPRRLVPSAPASR